MRDFLARVGSLRILYRYPCPHSTKLYFVCQTICRLSTPFVNLGSILFWQLIVLDVDSIQNFLFCSIFQLSQLAELPIWTISLTRAKWSSIIFPLSSHAIFALSITLAKFLLCFHLCDGSSIQDFLFCEFLCFV